MVRARTLGANEIVSAGLVDPGRIEEIRRVAEEFTVALTEDLAALIEPADPTDPIAAQFVPSEAELVTAPEERDDPIRSEEHTSELQSQSKLVCRLLLEKKKKK